MFDPNDLHKAFSPDDNDMLKRFGVGQEPKCLYCGKKIGVMPGSCTCGLWPTKPRNPPEPSLETP